MAAVQGPVVHYQEKGDIYGYDEYIEGEGIPVHVGRIGVDDVTAVPRKPWARTGGNGVFLKLDGSFQSERGLYVADIPGGGSLNPEKHLYDEQIFILQGHGACQVWQGNGEKITFEWGTGSIFAFPPNTTHAFFNGSQEPVVFMGVTTAPRVMNAVYDLGVVFETDYQFFDIYANGANFYSAPDSKILFGWYELSILHTNFIWDCHKVLLDDLEQKIEGGQVTGYRMGPRFPRGHISEWPSGRYHKAHYHGPGAILLGLDGEGYVLAWDKALGTRPYADGHANQVEKVSWGRNSIYVVPDAHFHQHFNTAPGPARHVAVYGDMLPMGEHVKDDSKGWNGLKTAREGGSLIDYEDEDPQIRVDFEAALAKNGLKNMMAPVAYRD